MDNLLNVVLVIHLLAWAVVLGGAVTTLGEPRLPPGALHGALTALVTGVLLTVIGSGLERDQNHVALAVKTLVAVGVTAIVLWGVRQPERITRGVLGAVAGLTVLNVAIAVFS